MSNHSPASIPWRGPARLPLAAGLLALLALLALGGLAWLAAGAPWAGPPAVEVVEGQPLRVTHGAPAPASPLAPGGRAALPQRSHDFGTVRSGEVVQHAFLIVNQGDTPLTIRGAYTTCGCTTALISAQVIPPGKAARATLIFDASFHDVRGQTVRRGLVIETSDPDQQQVEVWVQAAVR